MAQFPPDDPVLARAAEIARAHRARLTIVHVADGFTGYDPVSADLDLGLIQRQARLIGRESVEAAVARQEVGVAEIDIRIETGSPSLRLIELTDEINADLVASTTMPNCRHSDTEHDCDRGGDNKVRHDSRAGLFQKRRVLKLVYLQDMDGSADRISVLAPVGSALLGLTAGEHIEWPRPGGGTLKVRLVEVLYQPERAGEFHR